MYDYQAIDSARQAFAARMDHLRAKALTLNTFDSLERCLNTVRTERIWYAGAQQAGFDAGIQWASGMFRDDLREEKLGEIQGELAALERLDGLLARLGHIGPESDDQGF